MDSKIALTILAVALLVLGVLIVIPGGRQVDPNPKLPWEVTVHPDGGSTVLGLALGRTTLDEARAVLGDSGKVTLFTGQDGSRVVEVFLEQLFLSGLRANMVLTLDIPREALDGLYERGSRISQGPSGGKKVTLAPADEASLGAWPVRHLTYLPMADLEPDLIERRFGTPAERVAEAEDGIVHWLYPDKGMDIAVNPEGKEVIQYVAPREFARVTAPLAAPAD